MYEMTRRPLLDKKTLVTAVAAGLVATAFTGVTDKLLDRLVSDKQKRRDHRIRKGTAHELAGPYFAEKISGHRLSEKGKRHAKTTFSVAYSLVWGTIYGILRKKFPQLSRGAGMPFAIPFFFACDGLLAPMLGISPNLKKVPWQPSAKEMANHVAWTAAAEMVHRARRRAVI